MVVLDVFSGRVVVASTLLLLPPLLFFLLSCWGDVSFFFWVGFFVSEVKMGGRLIVRLLLRILLDYPIHVDNSVVDGQLVFLLLAKSKPVLDTNLKGIKNFCWILEVACNSDLDGRYFLLD